MAKFYLTNSKKWFDSTVRLIKESDFEMSFTSSQNGIYAAAVHKLKIKNTNSFQDKGKYVIGVGTAIYRESLDYSPMLTCREVDIPQIRKDTIGQYAFAVHDGDSCFVFTDRVGIYDVYYYSHGDDWYITTSLYDLALILRPILSLDEYNVYERAGTSAILNNETVFNEVYRLNGDQFIRIKNSSSFEVIYDKSATLFPLHKDEEYSHVLQDLAKRLVYKANVVSKVLGRPSIGMTGGVDSRLNCAVFLASNSNPQLLYLSPTRYAFDHTDNDDLIASQVADKLGADYTKCELAIGDIEADWDKYMKRCGFLYNHWGGAGCVIDYIENLNTNFITFGMGGEFYRTYPDINRRREILTFEELESIYANKHTLVSNAPYQIKGYKEHIRTKLQKVLDKYEVDTNAISPEDVFYLIYEYRKIADTHHVLRTNLSRYCSFLFMESDCIELCRISNKLMDDGSFMLDLMKLIYPDVLSVPFVSHDNIMGYDKRTNSLITRKDMHRSPFVRVLKEIYLKYKDVLKPLRDVYVRNEKIQRVDAYGQDGASTEEPIWVENKWSDVVPYPLSFMGLSQEFQSRWVMDCKLYKSLGF